MQESQDRVMTARPDGSDPIWLDSIGPVADLDYPDSHCGVGGRMSCSVQTSPVAWLSALNPGRIVQIFREDACLWSGWLIEPLPSADRWTIAAAGRDWWDLARGKAS